MRTYSLVSALVLLAACGGPTSNSNLDSGTGIDTTPAIDTTPTTCPAGLYGPKCNLHFDPTQFAASRIFCPSDSGRLEISGAKGTEAYLNGYYAEVPSGTFDRCVWLVLTPALGVNLPAPATGHIVPVAHGIEVEAIDTNQPFLADGSGFNTIQPLKEIDIFFNNNRGSVQLFYNGAFTALATTVVQTGTLGKTKHFSPFYLNVGEPVVAAKATANAGTSQVLIDFTGTVHAGSTAPWLLQFAATAGGTLLPLTPVGTTGLVFSAALGGMNNIVVSVSDQYGDIGTKQVDVTVDQPDGGVTPDSGIDTGTDVIVVTDTMPDTTPDSGTPDSGIDTGTDVIVVTDTMPDTTPDTLPPIDTRPPADTTPPPDTRPGPEAGPEAGKEAGPEAQANPCTTNPCQHGGSCTAIGGASYVCSCTGGWTWSSNCTTCASGWSGSNCDIPPPDPCAGVSCSGNSYCSGGSCVCSGHWSQSSGCTSCATGWTGSDCNTQVKYDAGTPDTMPPDTTPPIDTTPGPEVQVPASTISGLAIDCGSDPCWASGLGPGGVPVTYTYPVTFSVTNATTCTASAVKVSGLGTSGSVSTCAIAGNSGFFSYTTGNTAGNVIQITVNASGLGGPAEPKSINVTLE